MVICATTSAALSRRLATPPCWRVTSDPPTRDRVECHAGARPNSSAAADVTTIANPSSRASVAAARGIREPSGEINRTTPSRSHEAHTIPIAPPSAARTRLSVSNCRTRRPRLTPSATRRSISRRRACARASNRLAMFAQAMSRTTTTPPINSCSGRANCARSEETPRPAGSSVTLAFAMSRRTSSEALGPKIPVTTSWNVRVRIGCGPDRRTPGWTRPIMRSQPVPGLSSRFRPGTTCPHIDNGTHRSGATPTSSPKNPCGATPTIVTAVLLMRITRLRIAGSRAKRRCQ